MERKKNTFQFQIISLLLMIGLFIGIRQTLIKNRTSYHVFTGEVIGTSFSIQVTEMPITNTAWNVWKKEMRVIMDQMNRSISYYVSDSEVSRFNLLNKNEKMKISSLFYQVLTRSIEVYLETDGYFDITVSPLVEIWGFGKTKWEKVPEKEEIRKILKFVGTDLILLDKQKLLSKKDQNVTINFNAIAKGLLVDLISNYLYRKNSRNFIVEIGGECYSSGRRNQKDKWRIGIDTPDPDLFPGQKVYSVISVENMAIATSGDYRRYLERENLRVSHIINPETGYPVYHKTASVTVIARNCMEADAYATALFVMGVSKGLKWVNQKENVEAYFITREENSIFKTHASDGFHKYIIDAAP